MLLSVAGQSNADGRGDVGQVTGFSSMVPPLNLPYPAVGYYEKRMSDVADPLVWTLERGPVALAPRVGNSWGAFGPELPIGRTLFDTGVPVNIVKMALGSSSLNVHWDVNGTYPTANTPALPNLFTQWMNLCLTAQSTYGEKLEWIVWVQGESDASSGVSQATYETKLKTLIKTTRGYFPGVKWALNLLVSGADPFYNAIRTAQQNVVNSVQGVYAITADDLELNGLHFVNMGAWNLGVRFAQLIRPIYFQDRAAKKITRLHKTVYPG